MNRKHEQDRFAGEEYELFKLACPHYDEFQTMIAQQITERFQNKNIKIVEIGCAEGYTTRKILEMNPKSTVYAIDNDKARTALARQMLRRYHGRVHVEQIDALEGIKALTSGSIDAFATGFTIHNFPETYRRQILSESYRILTPGGIFVNGDKYARADSAEHQADLEWQMEQFNIFEQINRPDLKELWTAHNLEDDNIAMKEDESKETMRIIGFKNIRTVYRNHMEAVITAEK